MKFKMLNTIKGKNLIIRENANVRGGGGQPKEDTCRPLLIILILHIALAQRFLSTVVN